MKLRFSGQRVQDHFLPEEKPGDGSAFLLQMAGARWSIPIHKVFVGLLVCLVALMFAGCASTNARKVEMRSLKGTVWYREHLDLPANARILILLEEISRPDLQLPVIAHTRVRAWGSPPWKFTLKYDPQLIHPNGRYGLVAGIEIDGHLLFSSPEPVPVLTGDFPTAVKLMVMRDIGTTDITAPSPTLPLIGSEWFLYEMDGETAPLGDAGREAGMILYSDGRIAGFTGCNRFMGKYQLTTSRFVIGPLATTKKACAQVDTSLEQPFLQLLQTVERFSIKNRILTFYDDAGRPVLRFRGIRKQ